MDGGFGKTRHRSVWEPGLTHLPLQRDLDWTARSEGGRRWVSVNHVCIFLMLKRWEDIHFPLGVDCRCLCDINWIVLVSVALRSHFKKVMWLVQDLPICSWFSCCSLCCIIHRYYLNKHRFPNLKAALGWKIKRQCKCNIGSSLNKHTLHYLTETDWRLTDETVFEA